MSELTEAVEFIRLETDLRPKTAIVLGSGLGHFAKRLINKITIDCSRIPHYPVPQVEGHAGQLIFGQLPSSHTRRSSSILAFVGRPHYYESGNLDHVTFPVRLAERLKVKNLILTNAAGGVNPILSAGDLMLITDQINLTLTRAIAPTKWRTSIHVYDQNLLTLAREVAKRESIQLREGVYCGVIGPSYETAAEIQMIRRIGGDAVGMSTVHEAMTARMLGMRVLGISLITNLATGLASEPMSHEDVIRVARAARRKFERLLKGILSLIC